MPFGLNTGLIVPADFDGDGKSDIAINRNGGEWWIWRIRQSCSNSFILISLVFQTISRFRRLSSGKLIKGGNFLALYQFSTSLIENEIQF
jgi:hypothetical protein